MQRIMIILTVVLLGACAGPIGPFAGGALTGTPSKAPADWTFVKDVEVVQLETTEEGKPHSVNTWIGTVNGNLFLPTSLIMGSSEPRDRQWVKNVEINPEVRLRIEDRIYQLQAIRVLNDEHVVEVRNNLLLKYEIESDPHATAGWIYRLDNR